MTDSKSFTCNDELPTLYVPYPQCDHCHTDVEIDDGVAWCTRCLVRFESISDGASSKPDDSQIDDVDALCGIVADHSPIRDSEYDYEGKHWKIGPKQPCILPEDHTGQHLCPYDITTTPLTGEATS